MVTGVAIHGVLRRRGGNRFEVLDGLLASCVPACEAAFKPLPTLCRKTAMMNVHECSCWEVSKKKKKTQRKKEKVSSQHR